MVKNHLKRLAMPKTWSIKRKGITWVSRPNPGAHSYEYGMTLNIVIRDMLSLTKTQRETKQVLHEKSILVDGKRRKDPRFCIGFMDVLSIPDIKKYCRVVLDNKGALTLKEIDESQANIKISKIKGKTIHKGKTQLNLSDGRCLIVDKDDFKVGDSVLLELPEQKVKESIKLEKGVMVYLIKGKHIGELGTVEDISGKNILVKTSSGEVYETLKQYAFVVGTKKPLLTL